MASGQRGPCKDRDPSWHPAGEDGCCQQARLGVTGRMGPSPAPPLRAPRRSLPVAAPSGGTQDSPSALSLHPSTALGDAGGQPVLPAPRSLPAGGGSGVPVGHGPLAAPYLRLLQGGARGPMGPSPHPGGPGMGDTAGTPPALASGPRGTLSPAPPAQPRAAPAPFPASSLGTGAAVHPRGGMGWHSSWHRPHTPPCSRVGASAS